MDPLSQGILGTALAQSAADKPRIRAASFAGLVGGMLADADVFIRSASDPLLSLEMHRHFTHSLVFIPVGGLLAALLCWVVLRRWLGFGALCVFCTLGYATAGLLDACTTYGTHLFWPFSQERTAWSFISIVDPFFTLPIVLLCLLAWWRRARVLGRAAFVYALAYLALGAFQHDKAQDAVEILAQSRGHEVVRTVAHPTVGNLTAWRILYETPTRIYMDGAYVGLFTTDTRYYAGASVRKLVLEDGVLGLAEDSRAFRDLQRFSFFSDGWLGQPGGEAPYVVGDLRYASLPHRNDPLWGVFIDPAKPDEHLPFAHTRKFQDGDVKRLMDMARGR